MGSATRSAPSLGSLVIGVFVELWTWIVPNANDLKTVGALVVLILVLLIRPQGLLGTQGADRMNWSLIFWNALYTGDQRRRPPATASSPSGSTSTSATPACSTSARPGSPPSAPTPSPSRSSRTAGRGTGRCRWCSSGRSLLALLLGLPTLRLRADYLAIVTIAAAEIIRLFLNSARFTWLTGGTDGRNGWTGFFQDLNPFDNTARYKLGRPADRRLPAVHAARSAGGSWRSISLLIWALMRSPWGRVLKSIREDEDAARALGKNVLSRSRCRA